MVITVTEVPSGHTQARLFVVNIESNTRCYIDDHYTIKTTVTSDEGTANAWVRDAIINHGSHYCCKRLIIGIATQFSPWGRFHAATLQLCSGASCLIFKFTHCRQITALLRIFLIDPNVTFVGVSHMIDFRLVQCPYNFVMRKHMPIDLRFKPLELGIVEWSVPRIAREVLGIQVQDSDMVAEMSDWEAEELTVDQVKHATLAAFVPFLMGVRANAWTLNSNGNNGCILALVLLGDLDYLFSS